MTSPLNSEPESAPPAANEADWYDRLYQKEFAMAPWHRLAIPDLAVNLTADMRLLELGCGQAHVLRHLVASRVLEEGNVHAIDQSSAAVEFAKSKLPKAHLTTGDIYRLSYPDGHFDVCLMMEVIEHLTSPAPALQQIWRVLKPGGLLYLSFPNYLHLPWLAVRILAQITNHPNWILLQPIDKIYFAPGLTRRVGREGFTLQRAIGTIYGPPIVYQWEQDWMTLALNRLGLWWLSFHPIMVFQKTRQGPAG